MAEFVPASWISGVIDMDEIERDWLDKPGSYGVPKNKWMALKAQMVDGDKIRAFNSPKDFWYHCVGRTGYAIVRNGEAVAGIVTMRN